MYPQGVNLLPAENPLPKAFIVVILGKYIYVLSHF